MTYFFKPDCLRMLFNVPGAKSSLGLPGTVTRPGLLTVERIDWHVYSEFSGNCDRARLNRMLQLPMTARRSDVAQTFAIDKPDYGANLHDTPGLTTRLSDAGLRRELTKAIYRDHRLPPALTVDDIPAVAPTDC